MAENTPLRHVIIGAGASVYGMHAPAFQLETTQVVGLCDIDPTRGKLRAEELGVPFYTDYAPMLDELHPDVAVIITPHYCHAEITIASLRAGCHVLVEKPMALEVTEADAMIAATQETGRLLAVNFQHRQRPEVQAARRLLDEGALGTPQRLEMVMPWPRTAAYYRQGTWRATWWGEGGGVLMNQAPHDLDLACHLFGSPARVSAWTRTRIHAIEVEDTAAALLEWDNGAIGFLYATTAEGAPKGEVKLVGTGGMLRLGWGDLTFERFDQDAAQFLRETDQVWGSPTWHAVPVELAEGSGDHPAVYRNFHAAILHGAPISADAVEGRKSLELANAIIYSSKTGRPVDLPLDRDRYAALLAELKGKAA
ncbi:MAG: putative oxidoreductase YcjS [Chloroflexi bacterium ADurb.Bin325]|nr:MAG: putative oxidoreductase YcjS [Chloroflexi bacterium ADurb.Bin325]